MRTQFTRQVQLSYLSVLSASLGFYTIYLKETNLPGCICFLLQCSSVHKHRTCGWMVESSDWDFTRQKNDRTRGKKVKGSARNAGSDKPWALSCTRRKVKTGVGGGVRL